MQGTGLNLAMNTVIPQAGEIIFFLPRTFTALIHKLLIKLAPCSLHVQVPDSVALADDIITFTIDIDEYFSVTSNASILQRRNYGPNSVRDFY